MHATAAPTLALPSRKVMLGLGFFLAFLAGMVALAPTCALLLVVFSGIAGPLGVLHGHPVSGARPQALSQRPAEGHGLLG